LELREENAQRKILCADLALTEPAPIHPLHEPFPPTASTYPAFFSHAEDAEVDEERRFARYHLSMGECEQEPLP